MKTFFNILKVLGFLVAALFVGYFVFTAGQV